MEYVEYDEIPTTRLRAVGTSGPVDFETVGDWNEFVRLVMNPGDEDESVVSLSVHEARYLRDLVTQWIRMSARNATTLRRRR